MNEITIRISKDVLLPDQGRWINRFEIKSESSNRVYVVSQDKNHRYWGCSCPGWITRRYCKHLRALGIPTNEKPFEPNLIKS
jgi:hypothetical protein